MKQTEILTHATHVNGWEPAVYMSGMSQNFRLFHVSNLSVRNFRIFLLMYTGSLSLVIVALSVYHVARGGGGGACQRRPGVPTARAHRRSEEGNGEVVRLTDPVPLGRA